MAIFSALLGFIGVLFAIYAVYLAIVIILTIVTLLVTSPFFWGILIGAFLYYLTKDINW
jgi:hypothetical protein